MLCTCRRRSPGLFVTSSAVACVPPQKAATNFALQQLTLCVALCAIPCGPRAVLGVLCFTPEQAAAASTAFPLLPDSAATTASDTCRAHFLASFSFAGSREQPTNVLLGVLQRPVSGHTR